MTSAYEQGRKAAQRGKHIQACPFDTGTVEWHWWRQGFVTLTKPFPARWMARRRPMVKYTLIAVLFLVVVVLLLLAWALL